MSVGTILELLAGALFVGAGVWQYRRRGKDDPRHGSQSAVLLMAVGAIALIHGSGLLEYRPWPQ